jgi:hypothetical protein
MNHDHPENAMSKTNQPEPVATDTETQVEKEKADKTADQAQTTRTVADVTGAGSPTIKNN